MPNLSHMGHQQATLWLWQREVISRLRMAGATVPTPIPGPLCFACEGDGVILVGRDADEHKCLACGGTGAVGVYEEEKQ